MENLNFARTPQFLRKVINEARRSFIHSDDTAAAAGKAASNSPEEEATPHNEMELAHTLTLNEEALKQLPEHKHAVFELEWLRYLEKSLPHLPKHEIKAGQKKLVQQLSERIQGAPGPPMRKLIASALATLFSVGDTFMLFDTVNACNDILKNKDDSPSYLPTKLAAICVLGSMYEKLGRMMGRTYEDTVQILIRTLRNAESQARIEIMHTLEKVSAGMGTAIANVHKDIYKAAKHCLLDRVMAVRVAAARCILKMIYSAPFLYQTELESLGNLCFRAFDGSNYEVRCAVAQLLGTLLAYTQQLAEAASNKKSPHAQAAAALQAAKGGTLRLVSLDEALNILMAGFLRGGASFLKGTGEIIKGSSGVNREVRVGVTHAYVVFVQFMGSVWLERQLSTFLAHVLDLVANPKAACSHVDAVYSRKCINFILRTTIGKMLGEKAQSAACKELIHLVAKQMNSIDFNPENAKDSNQETLFSQHLLVCALQELSSLFIGLGTTAQNLLTDQSLNAIDATCAVLVHPCAAARLAAAWCLRSCCIAVPSQITPLIDRFIEAMEQMRSSPEAIAGYSCALAAILGSARHSPLGIPHTKGKVVFNCAEELLRSASQNSRMSLHRTQAGWLLIGAIMTLGSPVVKGLLPRMLLLWRNSFPRSNKELESEKARGDAFTWQVTLEGRAGALSVMHSFLLNCPDLVSEDITRRLLTPIESALAMLVNLATVLKSYGTQLKAPAAMVRLRLFETLTLLPPTALEASYTHLLRMLVSEFTLSDNAANTTNSLLRTLCHGDDSIILGTWLQETNHRTIEDQLQPNSAAGSGALEHDPCCLYRPNWSAQHNYSSSSSSNASTNNIQLINKAQQCPGPLPLGVAVIDMSVTLYGTIFPKVANKHRLQMLDHFAECIKQAKSNRQEAVQMNIFTALLFALKQLTDSKTSIGQEDVKKSATSLIVASLTSTNSTIRCAAGESLGRLAQVVADSHFTAELAQNSFDKLKSARDVVTRTGHSHALGCLHRYVGGMGSSQHLSTSVSILLALAQDSASPVVQVWSLYALAQIADSGGPMFRGYVEATLTLSLKLLLSVPHAHVDVHQCVGRVVNALITTVGPELQGNNAAVNAMRSSFLCAAALLQSHADPLVQSEAIGCLQQLHLFACKSLQLDTLVPTLVKMLASNYFILRKAAVACLRQLAHREAREVCDLAMTITPEQCPDLIITEYGLPGLLFSMLDTETDAEMLKNIHDTLTSMLQMLAADNLSNWLSLCKKVLTVAVEGGGAIEDPTALAGAAGDAAGKSGTGEQLNTDDDDDEEEEYADDVTEYRAEENTSTHPAVQPRWPTRVFAAQCVRRIISSCEAANALHFDLLQAKEQQLIKSRSGDYLILHLAELIRMSFMAATSDSDQLRLEGLRTLQEIIDRFANVPEPEFPGHLLLEQYQAQVGAALRPAFAPDTPSHVTAAACEVCSAWIGSGVARDISDLRRVHQLLVSSLNKLYTKTNSTQLYNESMATLEKLSILKAWAEVYIVAMLGNGKAPASLLAISPAGGAGSSAQTELVSGLDLDVDNRGESLLGLVQPELHNLSNHWLAAMKDHALLLLPAEFQSQLPRDGGSFYTTDTINSSKPHYMTSWPPIMYAAALWLRDEGFARHQDTQTQMETTTAGSPEPESNNNHITHGSLSADRFHMIFGICMEALCSMRSSDKPKNIVSCLRALHSIFDSDWARRQLIKDRALTIELCHVLHRQILTRDELLVQLLCVEILKQTIQAAREDLQRNRDSQQASDNANDNVTENLELGEGSVMQPGSSHVYAVLEVCLCLFVRQIPSLNPSKQTNLQLDYAYAKNNASFFSVLGDDNGRLVASGLQCVEQLLELCTPSGALTILPTILYMTTSIIREIANKSIIDSSILANTCAVQAALQCLRSVCVHRWAQQPSTVDDWQQLLQSALATIIDMTKTAGDNEERKVDEVTMLLAIAVFILHTPASVVSAPSLQYPCINHFRQCLQSENLSVKLKCIETTRSIFTKADLKTSTPYIHALAPRIIESLYAESSKLPASELELQVTLESIVTVDQLIELAEPQHRNLLQDIQMLTLLVPVLISYLADLSKLRTLPKYQRQLHEHALQWLLKIGPKYPQEFKALMCQKPELRQKLEAAIRNQQQSINLAQKANEAQRNGLLAKPQKPTIKLKTDFSNFQ
ncbi:HEAT repeat-containing protein 5B isoform X3 [Drosophila sulfurigaster albostrigata]|uniref:HEAT repeat-containing protein 5B isoform X3 n=1 Tax=Drosophila sulfurigaster albostrigata TaxID=89887 RepID=UPI002D21B4F3|nr:HEAT repeat-containing protein 5B isoform X3 [Drosophila sulfurigaster albostrigata]